MTDYDPRPLTDLELLVWAVVLAYRQQQTEEGIKILLFPQPDCPDCRSATESSVLWVTLDRFPREHRLVLQPCGHGFTAGDEDVERIGDHARDIVRLMTAADNSDDPLVRAWTPDDVVREARKRVGEPEPAATDATEPEHVCKPGATTYFCPASGETESDCHGGFDQCCDRPDLHRPIAETGACPACRRADQAGLAPSELHPECVGAAA